jgi:hypothetical protein
MRSNKKLRFDVRAAFAVCALTFASCQGAGLDSGMGGEMAPPVSQPGSMNGGMGGMNGGMNGGSLSGGMNGQMGPAVGPNGQEELANPGATLAPNEAQYPLAQGPTGMKCPLIEQFGQSYNCNVAFNIPPPSPAPSGSPKAGSTAKPTASPTPSPSPSASADADDDSSDDTPTPSPTPAGMMTMLVEPLPRDVPNMTNPNPLFMRITPLVAVRLQSTMDFELNGLASVQYTLPAVQFTGRVFGLQLYSESYQRGKKVDQILANYATWTSPSSNTVQFEFNVPKVTVRHSQIWLLALYGAQLPPGATPTPSPSPAGSASPSPSASP